MRQHQALVLVERNKVKVQILYSILFEKILIPQHVTQIHRRLIAQSVLYCVSRSVENASRAATHIYALLVVQAVGDPTLILIGSR